VEGDARDVKPSSFSVCIFRNACHFREARPRIVTGWIARAELNYCMAHHLVYVFSLTVPGSHRMHARYR